MLRRLFRLAATGWLVLAASAPPRGQVLSDDAVDQPLPLGSRPAPRAPQVQLRLVTEIPLPGPLPGAAPRFVDGLIEIPVAGGVVVTAAEPGAVPKTTAAPGPRSTESPVVEAAEAPDGRARYRAVPGGVMLAERRCRHCAAGWRRRWKLRVPGNIVAVPLVHGRRLYFGALDNRVYCLNRRNGHQLWAADAGARLGRPLALWAGERPLVLVIPDDGSQLLAFDAELGQRVARVELEAGAGRFVGTPLALPDGRIVVAHQKYEAAEAALRVYGVEAPRAVDARSISARAAGAVERGSPRHPRSRPAPPRPRAAAPALRRGRG